MPHLQPTALQQTVCKFQLDPQYHISHWGSTILGDSTLCSPIFNNTVYFGLCFLAYYSSPLLVMILVLAWPLRHVIRSVHLYAWQWPTAWWFVIFDMALMRQALCDLSKYDRHRRYKDPTEQGGTMKYVIGMDNKKLRNFNKMWHTAYT